MKILNIGSINIDYVYDVNTIAQPGETINVNKRKTFLGGKGINQSIALALSGSAVYHAGAIGEDGVKLIDEIPKGFLDTSFIKKVKELTGHAIIQVDSKGQNSILHYPGANSSFSIGDIDNVLNDFGKGDYLIIQNEMPFVNYAIEQAKKIGMIIVFNPSPFEEKIKEYNLHLVDWLVINELEGHSLTNVVNREEIIKKISSTYPQTNIILTLGHNGVYCYEHQSKVTTYQASIPTSVVDTTSAGDTFTGYFVGMLSSEKTIAEALKVASFAASISVSREGASTSIPNINEVMDKIKKSE